MKWKWPDFDLQTKAVILAFFGLIFWLATFYVVYFEITSLNQATINLELVEDLYDNILEMRRYEKNYLLYRGKENREQAVQFFDKAKNIYVDILKSQGKFQDIKNDVAKMGSSFVAYNDLIKDLRNNSKDFDFAMKNQEKIRFAGGHMIDMSKKLMNLSRKKVAETAQSAIRIPMASTGLVICMFFIGLVTINWKVIRPLIMLERATEKIGRGDFGPISYPDRVESEVDRLVFAFNRMVEELDARQEQIIHTRKIASLGTLVSGVAHELNNPINNIILTIDTLLGKREIEVEKKKKMLEDILEQGIRASGIVKNLLDFSRAEVAAISDVDVKALLNEIIKLMDNDLSLKKIKLIKEIHGDLPLLVGNRQSLQQVFFNLMTNAVQAMEENGTLLVRAEVDKNRWLMISVSDTGEGIKEENIPFIFDPFFTTKDVGKGTGLGLSVSYGIVKKHGGRITVESEKDQGTTFTVALPAKEEL